MNNCMREFDAYILQSFTEFGDVLGEIHILLHKISNLLSYKLNYIPNFQRQMERLQKQQNP